jgi:alkylation response protein AidB-like acyl-CoA dehydrogenase
MHEAFMALALAKAPRNQGKLADNPVTQSEVARHEARLGAARAYIVEILRAAWASADDVAPLASIERARVRLACSHGVQAALEVADRVYKSSGTSAIFLGTPFERRFRDIHTLSQQIQSRDAHFEAVGDVLLNGDPEDRFLG